MKIFAGTILPLPISFAQAQCRQPHPGLLGSSLPESQLMGRDVPVCGLPHPSDLCFLRQQARGASIIPQKTILH
jgi:hypothetical protein